MKNPVQLFFVAAAAVFLATACQNSKVYTVNISGEGLDFYPDSSRMLVFSDHADFRYDKPVADGYITDGRFSLSFQDSITRVYEMVVESDILTGSFMTYSFFSDREPLHFTFSEKYGTPRAEVTGSPDNEELYLYRNKSAETYEAVDSMSYELTKWRVSKYGEGGYPEEGTEDYAFMLAAFNSMNEMHARITEESGYDKWLDDRIRNHKSLAGLQKVCSKLNSSIQMMNLIGQATVDQASLKLYYEYRELYPDSWLVQQTDAALATIESLKPGMPAPDFSAPALDGERYSLSELIEGRIAVLDCWASWCLPCRRHSIELIPVYEQYKDKGFTVIGVAGEFNSLDDMHKAIETDGYPWIQLYDLDRAEGIWELYGIDGGGGGIFLIDSDGRIVEKVKDIASVKAYLQQHLD